MSRFLTILGLFLTIGVTHIVAQVPFQLFPDPGGFDGQSRSQNVIPSASTTKYIGIKFVFL